MSVVLGPCPCAGCGTPLVWNGVGWRLPDGSFHECRFWRCPECGGQIDDFHVDAHLDSPEHVGAASRTAA